MIKNKQLAVCVMSTILGIPMIGSVMSAELMESKIQLDVSSNTNFANDMPLENVVDGNEHTVAWPWELSRVRSDVAFKEQRSDFRNTEYIFKLKKPQEINYIRFWQHSLAFATSYRILANTTGNIGDWDEVLVDEVKANPIIPTDRWVEHRIRPIKVYALRFQPLGTMRYRVEMSISNPPALKEFEVYRLIDHSQPEQLVGRVEARIKSEALWSINGYSQIHDEMFSWANLRSKNQEFFEEYIEPINLSLLTYWGREFLEVPEDPDHTGHFDRSYFSEGNGFDTWLDTNSDGKKVLERGELANAIGGSLNVRVKNAPPYMRQFNFKPTLSPARWQQNFLPPEDAAEWGEMTGQMIRKLNQRSDGAIKWLHIWNEPNTSSYWGLPWGEKPEGYYDLYLKAVPEIRKLNPSVQIGGPVLSGGGILGWAGVSKPYELPDYQAHADQAAVDWSQVSGETQRPDAFYWKRWVKPLVDKVGEHVDFVDFHCYENDLLALESETRLFANYSMLKLGRVIPLVSSEANPNLYLDATNGDQMTAKWRMVAVGWAEQLMGLLNMPDKFKGMTYFYTYEWDEVGVFHKGQPNPIYWVYWIMRNARGERLWSEISDDGIKLLVTINSGKITLIALNTTSVSKDLAVDLGAKLNLTESEPLDFLEYDSISRKLMHGSRSADEVDGKWFLKMQPFGFYSLTIPSADPKQIIRTNEFYGDRVWQELTYDTAPVKMKISLPSLESDNSEIELRFGTSGIPYSRPRTTVDKRVPINVNINGVRDVTILAGKDNVIQLRSDELNSENEFTFTRLDSETNRDARILDTRQITILSASIIVTERP